MKQVRWALLFACLLSAPLQAAVLLVVTEIMYHPADEDQRLEYVEIYNTTRSPLDISGYRFIEGISYEFPEGTWIDPYSYIVVARDPDAFEQAYGWRPYGPYEGELDDHGERLTLSTDSSRFDENGRMIVKGPPLWSVEYNERGAWPNGCNGTGHSLSLITWHKDPQDPTAWARSPRKGGTPGKPNGFETTFEERTLIPKENSVWRFKKGTEEASDPIDAWRQIDFDDSSWEEGIAGFGYGDNDDATVLDDMRSSGDNPGYLVVFIRKRFTLESLEGIDRLFLWMLYDDGFVAYLNGREVARAGVQDDPPLITSKARTHEATRPELFDISDSVDYLRVGENVLCVQGHNASTSSPDFSLHPWLSAAREIKPVDVASGVVINEFVPRSASGGWIELYNKRDSSVDLSGYTLSRDSGGRGAFVIPEGTVIQPGEFLVFTQGQLGFTLEPDSQGPDSDGTVTVYLVNPDGDRVVEARTFDGDVALGSSLARWPDGADRWYETETPTPGATNQVQLERSVVINEIMYHPFHTPNPYENSDGEKSSEREYIELLNVSDRTVDMSGWYFSRGIAFTFPEGTLLRPGQYLVVARNPALIKEIYGLTSGVLGPFGGRLANGGELIRLKDSKGNLVDEVRYYDGGRWPRWPDGMGASLELVDPRQDNDFATAWEASDDRAKAQWYEVSFAGRHPSNGESEFQFILMHRGEVLLDDVQVTENNPQNPNLIRNPDFESGLQGWRIWPGTHENTRVVEGDAHSGNRALLLVAVGRGDNWYNNIEYDFVNPGLHGNRTYYVRFWAKWQRGYNRLVVRSHRAALNPSYNLAHCAEIPVPENIGSPGAPNTVYRENQGPVIGFLNQEPALPSSTQPIHITCRIFDADGVASAKINYRLDRSQTVQTADLFDDGAHGDGKAGDGLWGGDIPPQANNAVIAFWIEAVDNSGQVGLFPREGSDKPAVALVLDQIPQTELPRYRLVQLTSDRNRLNSRLPMANSLVPATFIFNGRKIYYNVGVRYRGSPWIRGGGNLGTGYRIRFNQDDKLHGVIYEMNLDKQQNDGGQAMIRERTAYYLMRRLARHASRSLVPYSLQQYVRFWHYPQTGYGIIYEHVQHVDRKYLSFWWGNDDEGSLFKVDDWFECRNDNPKPEMEDTAHVVWRGADKEAYRWFYKLRTTEKHEPYEHLIDLCRFVQQTRSQDMPDLLPQRLDVDEWLTILCVRLYIGDWDTIGYNRGKNAYFYFPARERRWYLIPWDSDLTFQSGHVNDMITVNSGNFPGMGRMFNVPAHQRRLYNLYSALISGPADINFIRDYWNRTYTTFDGETGGRPPNPNSVIGYMQQRNNIVRNRISAGRFRIRKPSGLSVVRRGVDETIQETIEGDAPALVSDILVNGESIMDQLHWRSVTRWTYTVEVGEGEHHFNFVALAPDGSEVGSAEVVVIYSRSPLPEIMDFTPKEGPDDGGTEVVITGKYFQEGASVYFGDYESTSVTFVNEEELRAVTPEYPPRGPASVQVRVVNPDLGSVSSTETFEFIPLWPNVVLLNPNEGKAAGGESVTIIGERFQEGIKIFFGDAEAPQVTFVDETTLRVTTPPGPIGAVDVRAENPDGRSSVCSGCFTYVLGPLSITRVVPSVGPTAGGNKVTIYGENIVTVGSPVVVLFGAKLAEVQEADVQRVVCTAPPGSAGSVTILLTDGAGRTALLPNAYTYSDEVPGAIFLRGDANGDGRLTVSDARVILLHLFGGPLSCEDAGDVDDDGKLAVTDAIRLLGYLFAGGVPPEPPFPEPGPDPTNDSLVCGQ